MSPHIPENTNFITCNNKKFLSSNIPPLLVLSPTSSGKLSQVRIFDIRPVFIFGYERMRYNRLDGDKINKGGTKLIRTDIAIQNSKFNNFVFKYKCPAMTRETLMRNTMNSLSRLPKERLSEVADFVDFILAKETEENLQKGIEKLSEESGSLNFLLEEEELYTVSNLKKKVS